MHPLARRALAQHCQRERFFPSLSPRVWIGLTHTANEVTIMISSNDQWHARPGNSLCAALHSVMLASMESRPSAMGGIDSFHARACAGRLREHPRGSHR